ncbi:hypothetical protein MPDQ_006689 [Monascus purpureus]|uniref:Uncharacterized protein n=1 Tax=Monascus purpureus TaxID=5098 RepID=A0A507QXQ5_MONPU|nr:hypothetical protein MPDQ_006689 [Monascus purpureus]
MEGRGLDALLPQYIRPSPTAYSGARQGPRGQGHIQGAAYLEVVIKTDEESSHNFLEPVRRICDPHQVQDRLESDVHTVDAPDASGYQFLQTRGLILIDNPIWGKW